MSSTIEYCYLGAISPYILVQPLNTQSSPSKVSENTTTVGFSSSKTTSAEIPAIRMQEKLSADDKEAQEKGFRLVARMEQLAQNDEGFRRWLQIGFDQIEAGEVVTFSEDGWKEE
jgi:hypothetical protein